VLRVWKFLIVISITYIPISPKTFASKTLQPFYYDVLTKSTSTNKTSNDNFEIIMNIFKPIISSSVTCIE